MAKIHEEVIVLKVSKLVKNDESVESITTDEIVSALEEVAQQIFGDSVIVELEVA
jgi:hypothetical protein